MINLANAHDVLTRESWSGADLAEIVADTIKPHSGGENRFRIDGPHVQLTPGAALAFAMALHELSTNAAKYGALSTEKGRVDIAWRTQGNGDHRRLSLVWTEWGSPIVVEPKRKGFGSRLIEKALDMMCHVSRACDEIDIACVALFNGPASSAGNASAC